MMQGLAVTLLVELVVVSHAGAGLNQWTSGGPDVSPTSLAIDPAMPATLYAGTYAGVFKSTDGGAHWIASNTGLDDQGVLALVVDPQTPTTLYAAIGAAGVFKSTDGGAHWSESGPIGQDVVALAVDPQTPATLYAATFAAQAVFKSTDGGAHWTESDNGLPGAFFVGFPVLVVDPQTPATLYVATPEGVFKSTDGAAHWSASSTGLPTNPNLTSLTVDPRTPTTLYAGTFTQDTATNGGGVFKSTDGGAHWTASNAGLPFFVSVSALAVDPQTPTTLYIGTSPTTLPGPGVFLNRPIVVVGDLAHSESEPRYFAFGRTAAGRLLTVVFTFRRSFLRVISARPMSRQERRGYGKATRA